MMIRSSPRTALRRARLRRESAGAALFIVAVTLGLLAAMGIYGLSATAYDIRAAGHAREAVQVQHAAEQGIIMTAEALSPGTAGEVVRVMQADLSAGFLDASGVRKCKTAKPPSLTAYDHATDRVAEACLVLSPIDLSRIHPLTANAAADSDPLKGKWASKVFTSESFGAVALHPFVRVELTNPIDWAMPAGFATSSPYAPAPIYTQIRASVMIELKPGNDRDDALANHAAQTVAAGRGRLVVGPYTP